MRVLKTYSHFHGTNYSSTYSQSWQWEGEVKDSSQSMSDLTITTPTLRRLNIVVNDRNSNYKNNSNIYNLYHTFKAQNYVKELIIENTKVSSPTIA